MDAKVLYPPRSNHGHMRSQSLQAADLIGESARLAFKPWITR